MTEIQRFKNVKMYKEMYGHPDALSDSVRMAIHFFVNFDVNGFNYAFEMMNWPRKETSLKSYLNLKTY